MTSVRIRPLAVDDLSQARAVQDDLARDRFDFLLGLPAPLAEISDDAWIRFVADLSAHEVGEGLPDGWVPETFRVAEVDGVLVGRVSARHTIEGSEFLSRYGGHVGYGVRSGFRRQGVASALLRFALEDLRGRDVDRALVTCDDANVASAATIERGGGVLEEVVEVPLVEHFPSGRLRRYWVELGGSAL
ncbi:GNAT family N-acetyltransferase [Paraoerskovia marina]|uniref:Predicted acetyltransferase n=1 Tax=Paraoerskovia marina TaxID=545619 RepID=A0A1H1MEE6_9CELL|nr:GNAT family N-acetyltransferase [Paraoerskovia marina]SDR85010.1 Predicted acetyltransferase [Paraoerskovia marina]